MTGLPATITPAGTSLVTMAPLPRRHARRSSTPGQYDSSRTYPDTVPDDNGFGIYVTPNGRLLRVVFSNEQHSRPYEHTVFQCNTAPVEEGTTEIYEHTPADTGKLTEVGIERRKHTYRFVQWLSPKYGRADPLSLPVYGNRY